MEVKRIIEFGVPIPEEARAYNDDCLVVSEFFFDTIQGEGQCLGTPAAFLRLSGCPLGCKFCDTTEVWKKANKVKIPWLLNQILTTGLLKKLILGQHLVITGGSPLMQQDHLADFIKGLDRMVPEGIEKVFIEVENECSIVPNDFLLRRVNMWNNSPKLKNSQVDYIKRYKPEAMKKLKEAYGEVYYKFVVKGQEDWEEILTEYIYPGYVQPSEIFLMPMGADFKEYSENREKVIELAVEYGVNYSPREHIAVWDKKTGV